MMEFIVSMLSSHIGLLCWKDIQLFDGINPSLIMRMKFLFSNTALHMYLPFHYVKCHLIFFYVLTYPSMPHDDKISRRITQTKLI